MSTPAGPSDRGLQIREYTESDATVVAVVGNLDMAAAPVLARWLGQVLRRRAPTVIVDLSGVKFMTTAGMSILMEAHRRCLELSMAFAVVADGPVTVRPLQLLGIDGLLEIHPTLTAAVEHLTRR